MPKSAVRPGTSWGIALLAASACALGTGCSGDSGSGPAPGAPASDASTPTTPGGSTTPPAQPSAPPPPPPATIVVTGITPTFGHPSGGEYVMVEGQDLDSQAEVEFATAAGRAQARVIGWSPTALVVETPPLLGEAQVIVTTADGQAAVPGGFRFTGGQQPDVFGFKARTDKWLIELQDKDGDGVADFDEAIAAARGADNVRGLGDASRARYLLLSYASQLYGNNPDGSRKPDGLPMSFAYRLPPVGATAREGSQGVPTGPFDFNVMAVVNSNRINDAQQSQVLGRAYFEGDGQNELVENNSGLLGGQASRPLGVFPDTYVFVWNSAPIPDSRRTLDWFCYEMASTLAHECGHSIGLPHIETDPGNGANNLMSASVLIGQGNSYSFDPATWAQLTRTLPGSQRRAHRAFYSARGLLAGADAVVIAQPMSLAEGSMELEVTQVLCGDVEAGYCQVSGFPEDVTRTRLQMAEAEPSVVFLTRDGQGGLTLVADEAGAVPLSAGRSAQEWARLVGEFEALARLAPDSEAWVQAFAAIAERGLASGDARIRMDTLAELSLNEAVVKALDPAAVQRLLDLIEGAPRPEAVAAAQVLIHRADPALIEALVDAAKDALDPELIKQLAGAVEQARGDLAGAAAQVRQLIQNLQLSPAQQQRLRDLLVELKDRGVVGELLDEVQDAAAQVDQAELKKLLDQVGTVGCRSALSVLQAVADDETLPEELRLHALRAIGRLDCAQATELLSTLEQTSESPRLRQGAALARTLGQAWLLR